MQRPGYEVDMTEEEIEQMLILDETMRRYEQRPNSPEVIPGVSFNGQPSRLICAMTWPGTLLGMGSDWESRFSHQAESGFYFVIKNLTKF
jgi:hypothetical protein